MGTKRVEEREEEEEWETERVSLSVAQPVWSFPPWDITSRWRMPRDESGRALQTLWWNSKWVKKTLYFDIEAARGAGTTLNTACQLVDVLTSPTLRSSAHEEFKCAPKLLMPTSYLLPELPPSSQSSCWIHLRCRAPAWPSPARSSSSNWPTTRAARPQQGWGWRRTTRRNS